MKVLLKVNLIAFTLLLGISQPMSAVWGLGWVTVLWQKIVHTATPAPAPKIPKPKLEQVPLPKEKPGDYELLQKQLKEAALEEENARKKFVTTKVFKSFDLVLPINAKM